MIDFQRFVLDNGLRVIVHKDTSTPIVTVNLLYDVGAKDENPNKTGFAHLFEHLMFGGSINIPVYDMPVQIVGGQNNAFTNNDLTNYYVALPKENLETAFWLESDRMLSLAFSEKSLEVQRNVVIEEFRQRYLNQPYGDSSLFLRPLAYKVHPYSWSTIGKEISHIENAQIQDVKDFFFKHYAPNNCILVVAGNVETQEIKELSEKWFGTIERRDVPKRNLPQEPLQNEKRTLTLERDVPFDAIYMAYHMCDRKHKDYQTCDLTSDLLSNGESSRLYRRLVLEQRLFSNIDAYISGHIENGLFFIQGKLMEGVELSAAEEAINKELLQISTQLVEDIELEKVKNKLEASLIFSETSTWNKAVNLAYYELLGDAAEVNNELDRYRSVTPQQIMETAAKIFRPENTSILYYKAKK